MKSDDPLRILVASPKISIQTNSESIKYEKELFYRKGYNPVQFIDVMIGKYWNI